MEKETTKNKKVFFEKKEVCNMGTARYQLSLARVEKSSVTKEFATSVCRLPEEYNQGAYRRFIDKWGTVSVLTVLSLGFCLDNLLRPFCVPKLPFRLASTSVLGLGFRGKDFGFKTFISGQQAGHGRWRLSQFYLLASEFLTSLGYQKCLVVH